MPLIIDGKTVEGPKQGLLVLPRESGDIVFRFIAITDDSAFDKLSPEPKPPKTNDVKLGRMIENFNDPTYLARMIDRAKMRENWYFVHSIAPSKIQWEQVKLDDIGTYSLWREELKAAGFSVQEMNTIWGCFLDTNVVSDSMLNEARGRFLASEAEAKLSVQQ